MLSLEDMLVVIAKDEKRFEVGSRESIERHNKIMAMADNIKSPARSSTFLQGSNPKT